MCIRDSIHDECNRNQGPSDTRHQTTDDISVFWADALREVGVDLADVNPRLLLRNARAPQGSFAILFSSMEETGPRHVLVDVITRQFGGGALGDGATLPK